jgi:hypothetical protein
VLTRPQAGRSRVMVQFPAGSRNIFVQSIQAGSGTVSPVFR